MHEIRIILTYVRLMACANMNTIYGRINGVKSLPCISTDVKQIQCIVKDNYIFQGIVIRWYFKYNEKFSGKCGGLLHTSKSNRIIYS